MFGKGIALGLESKYAPNCKKKQVFYLNSNDFYCKPISYYVQTHPPSRSTFTFFSAYTIFSL